MRLLKVKLSGFKSFVDPTVIDTPSQLIAIVGPNGCGKSNVIDAISWVMGESSPKYLRGEALTDVIFNGSSARKPVGQASVELIFENSDSKISGEYAKFAEISIKRIINRESDSVYYLNGARCRKRDIADILHDTGLGPRSYSIIGQNMIGEIAQAKPDELRAHLERAAGISKYKERRHETELRIHHTKENLARVVDLRTELENQLSHLKHQANVAEKYKTLKQQERVLRAEHYGIQWRQLDGRMVDYTLRIQREETALEARHSELSGTDREIEQLRHEQRVANDSFQEIQRQYYAVGNEITRVEQDILHHQERQQQWENDLKQVENDHQVIKNQVAETETQLRKYERDLQQDEPLFSTAKNEVESLQTDLTHAEDAMLNLQNRWDEFHQISAKTMQTTQVEKNHVEYLEQKISSLQKRQQQLHLDGGQFKFSELNQEIEELSRKSYELVEQVEFHSQQLSERRKEVGILQASQQDSSIHLDSVRSDLQRLRGQEASLVALQQTALGQRDNPATPWMMKHHLEDKSRLAQHIEVENGWELAVEKVLGTGLQAICVDQINEVVSHLNDFTSGNLYLFRSVSSAEKSKRNQNATLLLQKVKSPWSLDSLLSGVYVADSLPEALQICESLGVEESVITRDGIWLNRSWLKVLREEDPAAGVFQREQELKQLITRIHHLEAIQKDLEKNMGVRREKIQKLELERDQLQQSYSQLQAQSGQINAQRKMKQERLLELKSQSERCIVEQEECTEQLDQAQTELLQARQGWQQALIDQEQQTKMREILVDERDQARQQLQAIRENMQQKNKYLHELEMRLQTAKSQKTSLQQAAIRLQTQLAAVREREIILQSELNSMTPIESLKKSLSRILDKHVSVEVELNTARVSIESLDQEFHNLEHKRQTIEHDIAKLRNTLESLRVEWQGWKVKTDTIIEQIKETEFRLEDVLQDLPQEIMAEEWQAKLDQVIQRINRLGPINLVAIDEYNTCLERKQYLDKQLEDLQSGLSILEDAIAKIDKETRVRFKETFDKVNERFQELFPHIFGGGKAFLELTSDNLLEAGV